MAKVERTMGLEGLNDCADRRRLQHDWVMASILLVLAIGSGFGWMWGARNLEAAVKWTLLASLAGLCVLVMLREAILVNSWPDRSVLKRGLGWANWITIWRGVLICTLAGFLFQTPPDPLIRQEWLPLAPGILYALAAALDGLDGLAARSLRQETHLGKWLDPRMDAFGLLVASSAAVWYDRLPAFYVSAGLAYYVLQLGIRHRRKAGKTVLPVAPYAAARFLAGSQMGLVAVALFPLFPEKVLSVAAVIFVVPFLAGFLRDWLVVTGVLGAPRCGR